MIYKATKLIQAEFEENNIKCRTNETQNTSAVEAGYSGKNASNIIVRFISTDDDNDVAVRVLSFVKASDEKRSAILEAFNSLQRRFRYVSFTLDDDNDVHMGFDFPIRTENVGSVAVEMFIRMAKIADDAYPVLMKAMWS